MGDDTGTTSGFMDASELFCCGLTKLCQTLLRLTTYKAKLFLTHRAGGLHTDPPRRDTGGRSMLTFLILSKYNILSSTSKNPTTQNNMHSPDYGQTCGRERL